jgi:outer membrane lipoprotein LolB
MTHIFARISIVSLLILLSGCTTLSPKTAPVGQPMTWEARSAALDQIQSWTVRGSVSLQHAQRTDLASLQWAQNSRRYQFALFGPLGFGRVEITGQPNSIRLVQSNKPPVVATSPEALMQQELGWQIPVVPLYYWARGLPAPGMSAKTQFDAYHHLIRLEQEGWEILYTEYSPVVGTLDLPKKMQLTRRNLKIKLALKDWIVAGAP